MRIELCTSLRAPRVLAEALGARVTGELREIRGIATDSREVRAGDLFVAIKGEHTDGGAYIPQALAQGAVGVLASCERPPKPLQAAFFAVEDVIGALMRAATLYRAQSRAFVVAVSGSTGKTTVKEGIATVLSETGRTERTAGNFNSSLGFPLSVLSFEPAAFWVCELGVSHPGEMAPMARVAAPDLAVLTNVGHAHVGHFPSYAALLAEKADIAVALRPNGTVLLPSGLHGLQCPCPHATLRRMGEDVRLERILMDRLGVRGDLIAADRVITNLTWPMPGRVGIAALTAIAGACVLAGAPDEDIRRGLLRAGAETPRMRCHRIGERLLVDDTYNASPEAVTGAVEALSHLAPHRPIVAVLGDMLELGGQSAALHFTVGESLAQQGVALLVTYGRQALHFVAGALSAGMPATRIFSFGAEERSALVRTLVKLLPAHAAVLFKASGGMRMGDVLRELIKEIK